MCRSSHHMYTQNGPSLDLAGSPNVSEGAHSFRQEVSCTSDAVERSQGAPQSGSATATMQRWPSAATCTPRRSRVRLLRPRGNGLPLRCGRMRFRRVSAVLFGLAYEQQRLCEGSGCHTSGARCVSVSQHAAAGWKVVAMLRLLEGVSRAEGQSDTHPDLQAAPREGSAWLGNGGVGSAFRCGPQAQTHAARTLQQWHCPFASGERCRQAQNHCKRRTSWQRSVCMNISRTMLFAVVSGQCARSLMRCHLCFVIVGVTLV